MSEHNKKNLGGVRLWYLAVICMVCSTFMGQIAVAEKTRCSLCGGLGECWACFGTGLDDCTWCFGSGTCNHCAGMGGELKYVFGSDNKWVECVYCDGGTLCSHCKGSGQGKCSMCYGSGKCDSCLGTGYAAGKKNEVSSPETEEQKNTEKRQEAQTESENKSESSVPEDSNTITITINGEEWIFYLKNVEIREKRDRICAKYKSFNPRGEEMYDLTVEFNKNLGPCTLTQEDYGLYSEEYGVDMHYKSNKGNNKRAFPRKDYDFTFEITERSDDWMSYSGNFKGTIVTDSGYKDPMEVIELSCDEFSFTIGEEYTMPF